MAQTRKDDVAPSPVALDLNTDLERHGNKRPTSPTRSPPQRSLRPLGFVVGRLRDQARTDDRHAVTRAPIRTTGEKGKLSLLFGLSGYTLLFEPLLRGPRGRVGSVERVGHLWYGRRCGSGFSVYEHRVGSMGRTAVSVEMSTFVSVKNIVDSRCYAGFMSTFVYLPERAGLAKSRT